MQVKRWRYTQPPPPLLGKMGKHAPLGPFHSQTQKITRMNSPQKSGASTAGEPHENSKPPYKADCQFFIISFIHRMVNERELAHPY